MSHTTNYVFVMSRFSTQATEAVYLLMTESQFHHRCQKDPTYSTEIVEVLVQGPGRMITADGIINNIIVNERHVATQNIERSEQLVPAERYAPGVFAAERCNMDAVMRMAMDHFQY